MGEPHTRRTLAVRRLLVGFAILALAADDLTGQVADTVTVPLQQAQYDLTRDGRAFLLAEASRASFFMLGELHGENEIPALIRGLWPSMWEVGYRHIAAEISPWAANRLEFGSTMPIAGLWTQAEATFVTSLKRDDAAVLWGCDIEEVQPHRLIRELAAVNPDSNDLQAAADMVTNGYQRRMAPALLRLVQVPAGATDRPIGGASLRSSLVRTLEVESDRFAGAALSASVRRERVMKDLLRQYWAKARGAKVLLRFGRNHLHRGIDRRGVSTLGNFVAELAAAKGLEVFNVAAFAGGGKIRLLGPASDFDERVDDPAFAHLASIARYPATLFDLRPLRQVLHRLPAGKRSEIEASLVYWADSYDAIIFYREVTPLGGL
jgi:hypothetical protein